MSKLEPPWEPWIEKSELTLYDLGVNMPDPSMRFTVSWSENGVRQYSLVVRFYGRVQEIIGRLKAKDVINYRVHATWKPITDHCVCKWCRGGKKE